MVLIFLNYFVLRNFLSSDSRESAPRKIRNFGSEGVTVFSNQVKVFRKGQYCPSMNQIPNIQIKTDQKSLKEIRAFTRLDILPYHLIFIVYIVG